MTVTAVDERLLLEIIEGCKGATPGPWRRGEDDPWSKGDIVSGDVSLATAMVDFTVGEHWLIAGPLPPIDQADANAAHIARLDPQTVHALASELLAARREIAGLREGLASAVKIADEAAEEWDKAPSGMRAGKILLALAGHVPGYRRDTDAIHNLLAGGK